MVCIRRAAHAGYVIVLATQAMSALFLLLGHDLVVSLYTDDLAVAALAGTLLLFALALMERDGALMLVLWTVSTAGLVATGLLSEELARLIHGWLA